MTHVPDYASPVTDAPRSREDRDIRTGILWLRILSSVAYAFGAIAAVLTVLHFLFAIQATRGELAATLAVIAWAFYAVTGVGAGAILRMTAAIIQQRFAR